MSDLSFDVELALTKPVLIQSELDALEVVFSVEDRTENAWGLVLRAQLSSGPVLKDLLSFLVEACTPFESSFSKSMPVLRVAAFNPNVTCTVWIDEVAFFSKINAAIEMSVYPCE